MCVFLLGFYGEPTAALEVELCSSQEAIALRIEEMGRVYCTRKTCIRHECVDILQSTQKDRLILAIPAL